MGDFFHRLSENFIKPNLSVIIMVKKILFLSAAAFFSVLGARAQSTATEAELLQKIDSLQTLVNSLSNRAETTEDEVQQNNVWETRRSGLSFGYGNTTLTHSDFDELEWKSDFSFSLDRVKTRYFHKTPILGMIKIGYDLSFFGVDYVKYAAVEGEEYTNPNDASQTSRKELDLWQVDYRWSIGPSVYVNPISELKAGVYFHYRPTVTLLTLDSNYNLAYGNNFAFGASVVWKKVALGIEKRWGNAKYSALDFDEDDITDGWFSPALRDAAAGDASQMTPAEKFLSQKKNKTKNSGFRIYLQYRF